MLSDELFPVSTYFGVCKLGPGVLSARLSNGMRGHFSTTAEIADEGSFTVETGKFSFASGTTLSELPAAPGRRIRLMREGGEESLLVTGLQPSSTTMVTIRYQQHSRSAYRGALRLANRLVPCVLSRRK
jgi:hypothetical protein